MFIARFFDLHIFIRDNFFFIFTFLLIFNNTLEFEKF